MNPLAKRRAKAAEPAIKAAAAQEADRQVALEVSLALRRSGKNKRRGNTVIERTIEAGRPTGPLSDLGLSKRTVEALAAQKIHTVADLNRFLGNSLLTLANFGKKSLEELQQAGLV